MTWCRKIGYRQIATSERLPGSTIRGPDNGIRNGWYHRQVNESRAELILNLRVSLSQSIPRILDIRVMDGALHPGEVVFAVLSRSFRSRARWNARDRVPGQRDVTTRRQLQGVRLCVNVIVV